VRRKVIVKDGGELVGDCFTLQFVGLKINKRSERKDLSVDQVWCG